MFGILLAVQAATANTPHPNPTLVLATELSFENWHSAAAIEYRRLALTVSDPSTQAVYYWMAAWHYNRLGEFNLSEKMLNRAETADWRLDWPLDLLRGENALQQGNLAGAGFFMSNLLNATHTDDEVHTYAAKRMAIVHLRNNQTDLAKAAWHDAAKPADAKAGLLDPRLSEAVEHYHRDSDKSPRLGGILGIIPGMGYVYAGEYANALRSLLLNGIFIYGMADSARRDNWGAFSVIAFFELTWYTGSIYGGIDAAHRYNQRRLQDTERVIMGDSRFAPLPARLPVLDIRFDF